MSFHPFAPLTCTVFSLCSLQYETVLIQRVDGAPRVHQLRDRRTVLDTRRSGSGFAAARGSAVTTDTDGADCAARSGGTGAGAAPNRSARPRVAGAGASRASDEGGRGEEGRRGGTAENPRKPWGPPPLLRCPLALHTAGAPRVSGDYWLRPDLGPEPRPPDPRPSWPGRQGPPPLPQDPRSLPNPSPRHPQI